MWGSLQDDLAQPFYQKISVFRSLLLSLSYPSEKTSLISCLGHIILATSFLKAWWGNQSGEWKVHHNVCYINFFFFSIWYSHPQQCLVSSSPEPFCFILSRNKLLMLWNGKEAVARLGYRKRWEKLESNFLFNRVQPHLFQLYLHPYFYRYLVPPVLYYREMVLQCKFGYSQLSPLLESVFLGSAK